MVIMEIIAGYLGRVFDAGNRVFGEHFILIYPIHSVILPQGDLVSTS